MRSKAARRQVIQTWVLPLAVGIPVAAVIVYLLIWYGPDVLARHDIGNVSGPLRALRLQEARDAARGRLLTLGAGLFAAGALIFTARNSLFTQRTVQLTEQGQVTDRYTKAIEQLGSDKLDVRIGGIYALERVAYDSPRDHPTVMEVLAAFIREHSHEQWPPVRTPPIGSIEVGPGAVSSVLEQIEVPDRTTRPDVQAALTVIGRRSPSHDSLPVNLDGANLSDAYLAKANLARANLGGVTFTGANLTEADLSQADPSYANLSHADLTRADLSYADLTHGTLNDADLSVANFNKAFLTRATLKDACLMGAKLDDAGLSFADLTRADLSHADLTRADLGAASLDDASLSDADFLGADLSGTIWPSGAAVPDGWQRATGSAHLERADTLQSGAASN